MSRRKWQKRKVTKFANKQIKLRGKPKIAWAMYEPDVGKFVVLGEYFASLDGKEVPWTDRLIYAWEHEMTDEQKLYRPYQGNYLDYANTAEMKFGPIGSKATELCGPIWDHELPDTYILKKPKKSILPLSFLSAELLSMNKAALGILQSYGVGNNRIWPITIRTKSGKIFDGSYHAVAVTEVRDALILDQTEYEENFSMGRLRHHVEGWIRRTPGKMTISKAARDGAHLWRDGRFSSPGMFMSDDLRDAFEAAGVPLYKMHHVEEV